MSRPYEAQLIALTETVHAAFAKKEKFIPIKSCWYGSRSGEGPFPCCAMTAVFIEHSGEDLPPREAGYEVIAWIEDRFDIPVDVSRGFLAAWDNYNLGADYLNWSEEFKIGWKFGKAAAEATFSE